MGNFFWLNIGVRPILRAKDGVRFSLSLPHRKQVFVDVFGAEKLFKRDLWLGDQDVVPSAPFSLLVDDSLFQLLFSVLIVDVPLFVYVSVGVPL